MTILGSIEQTLLKADATPKDIEALCEGALRHGFAGVCVNPTYVPQASAALAGSTCRVVSVVNFPLGASSEASVEAEVRWLHGVGVHEIYSVLPVGLDKSGAWSDLESWLRKLRSVTSDTPLKLILETGYFGADVIERLGALAVDAGVDYLKTSTGFGPRGASVEDVRLLASVAGERVKVKASGGIASLQAAERMLAAGASRLGTSRGLAIADEWQRRGT